VRLVDAVLDRKVWVDTFEGPRVDAGALPHRIAGAAADAATRLTPPDN